VVAALSAGDVAGAHAKAQGWIYALINEPGYRMALISLLAGQLILEHTAPNKVRDDAAMTGFVGVYLSAVPVSSE